ncbi:MAG: hypothetical protein ACRDKT_03795 [Actinomycetota bacterium]
MKLVSVAVIVIGIGLALALGMARGFDATAVVILALIVAVGALAIAALNRYSSGSIRPATCDECGGVISPNAPYCKHCGAVRAKETPERSAL